MMSEETNEELSLGFGVIVPVFLWNAVEEIQRLTKFGRMVDLGFLLGANLSALESAFRSCVEDTPEARNGLELFTSLGEELQSYAKEQSDAGMPYLRALLTIRLVIVTETVIQDAVLTSLESVPGVLEREEVRRIKGPVAELLAASPAERAEFFAMALARDGKDHSQSGIGKYERLLQAVGLGGAIDDTVQRALFELVQVRNALVHAGGKADAKFCKSCPSFKLVPGSAISITSEMSQRYRVATISFLFELMQRWAARRSQSADLTILRTLSEQAIAKIRGAEASAD